MRGLTFLTLLMTICSPTSVFADEPKRLNDLFQREWDWAMQEHPTWASSLGDRRWNDRWPDVSLDRLASRAAHQKDVLKELDSCKPDQLPAQDRLNLELLRRAIKEQLQEREFHWDFVPLNQRGGIQTEDELVDRLRFQTPKDLEDWLARLKAFPQYMDQTIELMRAGIKARVLLPKIVVQRIPNQIDKQIVDDPTKSRFYEPFKSTPDTKLAGEARKAIETGIVPSFRKFKEFFVNEYLPACYDEVGIWQAPRGDEMYAFFARHHTTTDLTPQQIHEIGLKEVARIRAEMEDVKKQCKFEGSLDDFFTFLRTDKRLFYNSGEELLAATRALSKRIDPKLIKLFKVIPRMPYGVEPIPMNIAPDTTTAYYEPGAPDGSRAGTYYVNLYKPETRPKWEMVALSLHESVPGHHFQISRAMELGEMPMFRRHAGYGAYVEGWALYCERLGEEIGMYEDPYDRFGRLTYEMWRAVRLVVDTGIHHKRWTRQQAIDYFKSNAPKSEHDIINEVDRYIAWPGQALGYKIGELKIRELRARAEKALGEKFDVRDFNDAVLAQGAVPLSELERIVDEWIAAQKP